LESPQLARVNSHKKYYISNPKEVIDIQAKIIEIQDPVFALWLKEDCFN
jgi:hypothetical protein